VLSWKVWRSVPDIALLGASGRPGPCGELCFERLQHAPLFATLVGLENRIACALWARIAPETDRKGVRDLLEQANCPERPRQP
jgi:hypothetical protein